MDRKLTGLAATLLVAASVSGCVGGTAAQASATASTSPAVSPVTTAPPTPTPTPTTASSTAATPAPTAPPVPAERLAKAIELINILGGKASASDSWTEGPLADIDSAGVHGCRQIAPGHGSFASNSGWCVVWDGNGTLIALETDAGYGSASEPITKTAASGRLSNVLKVFHDKLGTPTDLPGPKIEIDAPYWITAQWSRSIDGIPAAYGEGFLPEGVQIELLADGTFSAFQYGWSPAPDKSSRLAAESKAAAACKASKCSTKLLWWSPAPGEPLRLAWYEELPGCSAFAIVDVMTGDILDATACQ